MLAWEKKFENICVINGRGLIYSVEEVSDLLGIPRPTLYRYLREYSIPHLRRSGKISIPEESFDRIREARDLHKEGLGTESVRRALREGNGGPDTGEIKERIERISESLEKLKGNGSAADEALSSQAMRTVLARQSLMLSAMFNLTEMVEELLLASGKPRKTVFEEVEGEIREVTPLSSRTGLAVPDHDGPTPKGLPAALPAARPDRFGSLARRRRASLALLATLLVGAILLLVLPALDAGFPFAGDQTDERASSETQSGGVAGRAPSAGGEASDDATGTGSRDQATAGEGPDVSGKSVVEAARVLSRAGYEVAAIRTVKSDEEAGTVVRVEPAAGSEVEPGAPVVLVMSGGPTGRETGSS
jgi:excisionase family DNA binding protein